MTAPHNQCQPNIVEPRSDFYEAVRLLVLWSEIPGAEDMAPGHDTFAFLGKENSAGWVWAAEVKQERNFDAEQARQRDLAMQCIRDVEEHNAFLADRIEELEKALRVFTRVLRTSSGYVKDAYELHVTKDEYAKAAAALPPVPGEAGR